MVIPHLQNLLLAFYKQFLYLILSLPDLPQI